jgi:hypothetical protein
MIADALDANGPSMVPSFYDSQLAIPKSIRRNQIASSGSDALHTGFITKFVGGFRNNRSAVALPVSRDHHGITISPSRNSI